MGKTIYYSKTKSIDKLPREEQLSIFFDLINAFRFVRKPIESALLLQDLLTATEIKHLGKRLRIAKMLLSGTTQRDTTLKLHCSFATVTKVSLWLNQGGDGFKNVVSRLPKQYPKPKKLPSGPIEFHLPEALMALTEYSLEKHQKKQIESFAKSVESKKYLDKSLQKLFNDEFRTLPHKRKSG